MSEHSDAADVVPTSTSQPAPVDLTELWSLRVTYLPGPIVSYLPTGWVVRQAVGAFVFCTILAFGVTTALYQTHVPGLIVGVVGTLGLAWSARLTIKVAREDLQSRASTKARFGVIPECVLVTKVSRAFIESIARNTDRAENLIPGTEGERVRAAARPIWNRLAQLIQQEADAVANADIHGVAAAQRRIFDLDRDVSTLLTSAENLARELELRDIVDVVDCADVTYRRSFDTGIADVQAETDQHAALRKQVVADLRQLPGTVPLG
jgi:hypothetical protein